MSEQTIDIRPFGGAPADAIDGPTFRHRRRGEHEQSFTHVVVSDLGTPGRRSALGFASSLENARQVIDDQPAGLYESGGVWIEELPAPAGADDNSSSE